jgi:uncharacterized protein (TIRG00374 family)
VIPWTPSTLPRDRIRLLLLWSGLALSIVFGYLAVRKVRWDDVWTALQTNNYWWLIPAVLLLAVANLLRALRWQSLFDPETRPSFSPTLEVMLLGQCFNNILPVRAGEAVRIMSLHKRAATSRAETTATVVLERAFDVLSLLVLLFCVLPWLPHVSWIRAAAGLAIGLTLVLLLLVGVLARHGERPFLVVLQPLRVFPFVSDELIHRGSIGLTRGLAGLRRPRVAGTAFGLTVISWFVIGASFWVLMLGFDLGLPFTAGLLVVIATGLGMIIPSAPGAVGVFEAATVVALGAYGVPNSRALSYALVLHAINIIPYLVAGAIILGTDSLRRPT